MASGTGNEKTGHTASEGRGARQRPPKRVGVSLPAFVSLRAFRLLWALFLAVLTANVFAIRSMEVPEYAYGAGMAFDSGKGVAVAVMLPPEYKGEIRVEQNALLRLDQSSDPVVRSVSEFDPEVISPSVAQRRYALSDAAASMVTQPVVVAIVPLGDLPNGARTRDYVGGVYAAEIETSSRSALSMFGAPIDQLIGGWL